MSYIVIVGILGWVVSGIAGFVFWWTKDHNLTTADLPLVALSCFTGPLNWLIGWSIHGNREYHEPKILKRRRHDV